VRAHLQGRSACRATLRAYRAAPSRLAELVPPAFALPAFARASWWSRLHDLVMVGAGERAGAAGYKLQQAVELASAQKAAAVVASTAALAGGAVAGERVVHRDHSHHPRVEARARHAHPSSGHAGASPVAVVAPVPAKRTPTRKAAPQPARKRAARQENRGGEFDPEGSPAASGAATSRVAPASASRIQPSSSAARGQAATRPAGQEFGP
jgi:hypothetical protein